MSKVETGIDLGGALFAADRVALGRAITLMESEDPEDKNRAEALLDQILPRTGKALRVGISGVPGAGKSTLIDALGLYLIKQGHRVAVLAVDPSSAKSGGSILGDKTRMNALSREENAFIRPSPSSGTLGGVARKTREAMLCCEAAGYDVVLIETVGVGQSETVVADMVDVYAVLMIVGAGDELQGIKRGILEMADVIVINKADGDNRARAEQTSKEMQHAMHLMRPKDDMPSLLTTSALEKQGIAELWQSILAHRDALQKNGQLEKRRTEQAVRWMWQLIDEGVHDFLRADGSAAHKMQTLQQQVRDGRVHPTHAARQILEKLTTKPKP